MGSRGMFVELALTSEAKCRDLKRILLQFQYDPEESKDIHSEEELEKERGMVATAGELLLQLDGIRLPEEEELNEDL